jgi:hypothetical protein
VRENIGCAALSGRPVHDLLSIEHEGNEAAAPMMGIHLGGMPARYGVVRVKERSEAVRHPAWGQYARIAACRRHGGTSDCTATYTAS